MLNVIAIMSKMTSHCAGQRTSYMYIIIGLY